MKQTNSITHRFLMYLLSIILLSNFLIFGIFYMITRESMTRQSRDMGQNLMESNLTMIEQYFGEIDNIAASIIYNKDVISFLKSRQDDSASMEFMHGMESIYYNSRPDLQLTFYKAGNPYSAYSIYAESDGIPVKDYRDSDWYRKIINVQESKAIVENTAEGQEGDSVHSVIYKVEDIYTEDIVGYLKVDMDLDSLGERFLHNYAQIAGTTITDEEGNILFSDKTAQTVSQEVYAGEGAEIYETADYILAYGISEKTGWRLCMAMSKAELFRSQNAMVPLLLTVLLIILLLTGLISNKCFTVITVNYKRLVRGMEQVKQGNLDIQVKEETQDEISLLIRAFNDMMRRVDELLRTVETKQILLKEAEIKALQQQINPHFMHNIMETIMGLASEGMDDEVITVSECMSAMLRYNTHFENITTVQEEMKQIKNYVTVLKIRFEDRFEVFYDVDEKCLDCRIVKFTLQPLVENAISHGLKNTWSDGMLRVRIKKEEENISILIFDNGCGIEKEQLGELNRRLLETAEKPLEYIDNYKSLGIMNVHLRLKLYFGEAYCMEIFSKEQKGTCISIKVPYQLEE